MDMAELGAAASEKKRSPVSDEIKQREAFRWLKTLGYEPNFLEKLEKEGLVHKKEKAHPEILLSYIPSSRYNPLLMLLK